MIREADKSIEKFLLDDPVRPDIPLDARFSNNNKVFYYYDSEDDITPKAIVCAAFRNYVPTKEDDILQDIGSQGGSKVLTLYTIWSYASGAGRSLVFELLDYVKTSLVEIERIVTLSPKTEMARKFHTKNGAFELQENDTTINYEYPVNKK